jgi:hypothetical protein
VCAQRINQAVDSMNLNTTAVGARARTSALPLAAEWITSPITYRGRVVGWVRDLPRSLGESNEENGGNMVATFAHTIEFELAP